jgi:upstream activation factor subunit UAF30
MEESMAKAAGKAKANSAFMKPMQPSEHLAKIVGAQPLPRSEVTKKIWAHIKKNKLQNPSNKREILPMKNYSRSSAARNWTCSR